MGFGYVETYTNNSSNSYKGKIVILKQCCLNIFLLVAIPIKVRLLLIKKGVLGTEIERSNSYKGKIVIRS